ncbi:MAG: hypothetical protein ACI8TP_000721 [Acidimicrobiales bacterium]|jgi:hypothetical protein
MSNLSRVRFVRWLVLLSWSAVLGACTSSANDNPQAEGSSTSIEGSSDVQPSSPEVDRDSLIQPSGRQPLVGVAVKESTLAATELVETKVGVQFEVVRTFARWDDRVPNADLLAMVVGGRRVHLSVRPRTNDGSSIPWADLAASQPGSALYGQFIGWVDRFASLPVGSYVTINHEPETGDSRPNGSAEDFVAMWRRLAQLLDERGGEHVQLTWTLTNGSFRRGTAESWYPGDDVVDVVGADSYNWYTCQATDRAWVSFGELIQEPLRFARAHGKPLAVPELGPVEDPEHVGRKAAWIADATVTMQHPEVAADLAFFAWFDITAPDGNFPDCVWNIESSESSAAAFAEMIRTLATD